MRYFSKRQRQGLAAIGILMCYASGAWPDDTMKRVGVLSGLIPVTNSFMSSLGFRGHEQGKNVTYVWKHIFGDVKQLPKVAKELVDGQC